MRAARWCGPEEKAEGENRKLITIRHSYSGPQRPNIYRLRKNMLIATLGYIYLTPRQIIYEERRKERRLLFLVSFSGISTKRRTQKSSPFFYI